jgi:hypothetical protein
LQQLNHWIGELPATQPLQIESFPLDPLESLAEALLGFADLEQGLVSQPAIAPSF